MILKENKHQKTIWAIGRAFIGMASLYFFICSLDVMATAGRLMAGKSGKELFSDSEILQLPIVGLMLGILVTVMMQSSSTTTSIIVGLVGADLVDVKSAIYMIMGANIGTSVTSTIVALTQIGNKDQFQRAFSAAVVHDFFNWLTVSLLLVLEVTTGMLFHLSESTVKLFHLSTQDQPPELLKAITKPLTKSIIQIDKNVLKGWTLNKVEFDCVDTILKKKCPIDANEISAPITGFLVNETMNQTCYHADKKTCGYLFANTGLTDKVLGLILLVLSVFVLVVCLILLVNMLNSLLKEKLAKVVTDRINSDLPYVPWLTGYLMILIGAIVTFLVQSSSVFTATITPLVGSGVLTLERAYPLTLGSNIGTCTTGLLAALTADSDRLKQTLQISLCHFYFNIIGILVFYPIPFLRLPIPMAKIFGEKVGKHRWFALMYLVIAFVLIPLYVFGLSLANKVVLYIGVIIPLAIVFTSVIINVIQQNKSKWLPMKLQDWEFLPLWMHSLKPYDRIFSCLKYIKKGRDESQEIPMSYANIGYVSEKNKC